MQPVHSQPHPPESRVSALSERSANMCLSSGSPLPVPSSRLTCFSMDNVLTFTITQAVVGLAVTFSSSSLRCPCASPSRCLTLSAVMHFRGCTACHFPFFVAGHYVITLFLDSHFTIGCTIPNWPPRCMLQWDVKSLHYQLISY